MYSGGNRRWVLLSINILTQAGPWHRECAIAMIQNGM